jgi:hypothetical protein
MNDELENVLKEVAETYFKVPRHSPEGPLENPAISQSG